MKALFTAFATLGFASASFALPLPSQEHADWALENDEIAWDITAGLTTEVGQRMPGTEAEARARQWALAKLNKLGLANVREENFDMPTWVRGEERAEIMAPFRQKLTVTALGNSASTGENGVEGVVDYYPSLAALSAAPIDRVMGKIVFVDHKMGVTQDGSGYGHFGQVRWQAPNLAAEKGALAVLIRSVGTDHHRNPHTGNTTFQLGVAPIPSAALTNPDADLLIDALNRSSSSVDLRYQPVRIQLTLTPENKGQQQSGNVIAELPGRNRSLAPILVACHLDSWDLAPSAFDNAAGCGIITAATLHTKRNGQNLRTITLLWAGAEEVGVWGGKDYAKRYGDERHAVAMESDFGADRIWRIDMHLPESQAKLAANLKLAVERFGVIPGISTARGGADVRPIISAQNLAVIDLKQDGTRYFDLHHSPDDTLDKVDPDQLRQNVAVWTAVLELLANARGDFSMPVEGE